MHFASAETMPTAGWRPERPRFATLLARAWRGLVTLLLIATAIAMTAPFALDAYYGSGVKNATGTFLATCAVGAVLPALLFAGLRFADERWPNVALALLRPLALALCGALIALVMHLA